MARRGPKPRPPIIKLLRGDPSGVRGGCPPGSCPARPEGLDPHEQRAWDRVVPVLAGMGVLAEVDGEALRLYCHACSVSERAWAEVEKDGLMLISITGVPRPHPAAAIAHRADQLRLAILPEFGMTPSSRSRVQVESQPRDALADFLGKKESKHV